MVPLGDQLEKRGLITVLLTALVLVVTGVAMSFPMQFRHRALTILFDGM
ncbi:hypothetical protein AB0H34_36340 [Saccharopolyspora shandongensis]